MFARIENMKFFNKTNLFFGNFETSMLGFLDDMP